MTGETTAELREVAFVDAKEEEEEEEEEEYNDDDDAGGKAEEFDVKVELTAELPAELAKGSSVEVCPYAPR